MPERLLRITTVPISLHLLLKDQLPYMAQNGYEVLAVSADGPECDAIRAAGIAHQTVPMVRTISPLKDFYSLILLLRLMYQWKPDIVHTHTPKAGLLGMCAAWLLRVPVRMHTVAGLPLMESTGHLRQLLVLMERLTYFFATGVYPNSRGLLSYIKTHVSASDKLQLIGQGTSNGIDTSFFSLRHFSTGFRHQLRMQLAIAEEALVFCFVGRLVREKGIAELVEAFMALASGQKAVLLLVGPQEPERDPLPDATLQHIAQHPDIIGVGYQADVRPYLSISDAFVFPSYREGFPNVLLQAGAMELPCIASHIVGNTEVVKDGATGLLFQSKNAVALHEALVRFKNLPPDARKTMGRQARQFVGENFERSVVWSAIADEYTRQLQQARL